MKAMLADCKRRLAAREEGLAGSALVTGDARRACSHEGSEEALVFIEQSNHSKHT